MPRYALAPERVRQLGVELNDGRIRGWLDRVSTLLDVPRTTLQKWCAPVGAASSRAIPGPAASLLLAYVALRERSVPPDVLAAMIQRQREGQVGE